jgi:hypothetical protein
MRGRVRGLIKATPKIDPLETIDFNMKKAPKKTFKMLFGLMHSTPLLPTHLKGSVANISLNTIYSGSFKNKTTTDSGFKNICDRTHFCNSAPGRPYEF